MQLNIHEKHYDETLGLFVHNEHKGHQVITHTSSLVSHLTNRDFVTTRYGEFDIINDFSEIPLMQKTMMKKE